MMFGSVERCAQVRRLLVVHVSIRAETLVSTHAAAVRMPRGHDGMRSVRVEWNVALNLSL